MDTSTDLRITGIELKQNMEAETSVLGAVLLDNDVLDDVVPILKPRDFAIETHQLLWKAILYQYERNQPADFITMSQLIIKHKRTSEISTTYLTELMNSVPTTANAKFYAKIVRSNAIRRRAIQKANEIITLTEEEEFENDEDYLREINKRVEEIWPEETGKMMHIREIKDEYFDYLLEKDDFIFTGFKEFDEWMGGIGRGWLYVLAGRPSIGKTAKMLQMARGIARKDVGEVLIWSQEMTRKQLLNRMLPSITGIPASRLRQKKLTQEEYDKAKTIFDEQLTNLPLHVQDASSVTIEEIKATARQIKRRHGRLAAIIVDYLQIMDIPQQKGENRTQAIAHVTRSAKNIALEMDCPFILLSQLNRESEKDQKPKLSHLKESGAIEQDADVVEFLWHDKDEFNPNGKVIQSIIAKGRDVGTNEFKYLFKDWMQHYEELKS